MTCESTLSRLAHALTDDLPIDWERELSCAQTAHERSLIEQMRVIATIAVSGNDTDGAGRIADESVGAPPPPEGLPPLARWGHLEILEPLGGGSAGIVYRAWDRRLARQVALKLLTTRDDPGQELAEARLLAQLRHPSVVTVFGADRIGARVGLWMELVEGRTLEDIVSRDGPFSPREAANVVQDVCVALAAVHRAGLLHRDVKAQNIMRERGGRIVVMDFGAGRHSTLVRPGSGDLSGTPLYMAPELLAGGKASICSDVYSVGVLLFRLVTGSFPVEARTLADVRAAHESGIRRNLRDLRPDLPDAFIDVVDRALEPRPERRFDSASSLGRALVDAIEDRRMRPALDVQSVLPRRRTLPVAIVATALMTVVATLVVDRGARELRTRTQPTSPAAVERAGSSAEPRDAPAVGMSKEQRDLVAGFEELAGTLGAKGDWTRAAGVYEQVRMVHGDSVGEFAPVSGLNIARSAWARHRAGKLDDARYLYEEAVVKLETTIGDSHPFLATTMGALAMLHYEADRHADATAWLNRALQVRQRVLGMAPARGRTVTLPPLASLDGHDVSQQQLLSDRDGDGLLPVVEIAIGLDPAQRDSDKDGVPDGDELAGSAAVSNCMLYCLTVDPTKVIAHYGTLNPRREGFFRHLSIEGTAIDSGPQAAWNMRTGPLGYYFHKLTSAQKLAAVESGWRLTLRGRVQQGLGYTVVDLTPNAARWDINLLVNPQGLTAHLTTTVVPFEGTEIAVPSPNGYPPMTLVWSPPSGKVAFYMNGVLTAREHPGTTQFQDDRGLMFGTGHRIADTQGGNADFALVWLEIW